MQTITTIHSLTHVIINAKSLIRLAETEHNAARAELLASEWDHAPLTVPGLGTIGYVAPKSGSVSVDRPALDVECQRAASSVASAQGRIRRLLVACTDPELARALGAVARDLDRALVTVPTKVSAGSRETIVVRLV